MLTLTINSKDYTVIENSIIFKDDIQNKEFTLEDLSTSLAQINRKAVWTASNNAIVIIKPNPNYNHTSSLHLECSPQSIRFAIGKQGKNAIALCKKINEELNFSLDKISIKKSNKSLIKIKETKSNEK